MLTAVGSFGVASSFPVEGAKVYCMVGTPDGYATGHSGYGRIRLWSFDGVLRATLDGHSAAVRALACGPSGDLISGSEDGMVKVWRDGVCALTCARRSLTSQPAWIRAVAVSPLDGSIVSGSQSATATVWNGSTGEHMVTLKGHATYVLAVCVLANGDVVTASHDMTVRVWQRGSWACTAVHAQPSHACALLPLPTGGFAVGGGPVFDTGFVSVWRDGACEWNLATRHRVLELASVGNLVVACEGVFVQAIQDGDCAGVLRASSDVTVAAGRTGTLMALQWKARSNVCTVVRVGRQSRFGAIQVMVTAWSNLGGIPPPPATAPSREAALARTLSLRRLCRPRGNTDAGRATEIVEPFAQGVVLFL